MGVAGAGNLEEPTLLHKHVHVVLIHVHVCAMPKEMSKFEFQSVAIFAFDARCLPAYKLFIERVKRASKNTGTLILSTDY